MEALNGQWSLNQAIELNQVMLVDSKNHGVFYYDFELRITGWSEGASFITGWTAEEALGQLITIFWTPEDNKNRLAEHEAQLIQVAGFAENERWHMRKDGSQFWTSGVGFHTKSIDGTPTGFIKIFRDATHLHARTKYLENVIQECEARLREKDLFIGTIVHEMRNPLSPLKIAIELLKRFSNDSVRQAQPINVMKRQISFLEKLIEDLVDLTRISTGKMSISYEQVILQEIVFEAIQTCGNSAEEKGIKLHYIMPPVPIEVEVDSQRLLQVILNLLNNAIKYTSSGGEIWMSFTVDHLRFILSVKDNGQGIGPDLLPKIFDILTQANGPETKRGSGLGIGLAVVKDIVARHQGNVEVRSDGINKGSEFIVRIPLRRPGELEPELLAAV
jgi:PAS domain S-box-containing protein